MNEGDAEKRDSGYKMVGVAAMILVIGVSITAVIIAFLSFGYMGSSFSATVLEDQQVELRDRYGLPPIPPITPQEAEIPPSLRNVTQIANTTGVSVNIANVSIPFNALNLGDDAYTPNVVNITSGGTVSWTNNDSVFHTVTSGTGPDDPDSGSQFDSGLDGLRLKGVAFSHTFAEAGVFEYYCTVHPQMRGTVQVS